MHEISPEKWALFQPLIKSQETIIPGQGPVEPIKEPFGRDRVIYAPHVYQMSPRVLNLLLDRFQQEAALSNAPLIIGEWGPPTQLRADEDPALQARYTQIYQITASELDSRGMGESKPGFAARVLPLRRRIARNLSPGRSFQILTR